MKSKIKQLAAIVNRKTTAALVAVSAFAATNAYAGPLADAVKQETTDFKTDLYAVGGIAISLALVGVGVALVIRMMRRA